jgi:predicted RNA-binding protein (virulence factor B family)
MELGNFNDLTVVRESDIAWILTDGDREIFLHKKEAGRSYEPGEKIRVFLYVDAQGRPAATTAKPLVTTTTAAFLEVVSINHDFGVFLANGIAKDLLLSKDDLPLAATGWPVVGDRLFVTLRVRKDLLFARQVARKTVASIL